MFKPIAGGLILAALALLGARPGYVITGQVSDETGGLACGVRVCAFIEGFDPKRPDVIIPCALTDQRGQFALEVGRPGRYTLFYYNERNGYWSPYFPFFRSPSAPAPEVALDEANAAASVNISMLPKNGVLAGSGVDDSTGLPVDNLEFVLCHAGAPEVCWSKNARSAEGEFQLPAAHVPFTVRVKAEGYDDWIGPDGAERESIISIEPGMTVRLTVRLKRSSASAGRALAEAEKREGVHLPAPAQTAPAEGAVFNHFPRRTRLEWAPVEGAVSYAVEVDYCSGRRKDAKGCPDPQPLSKQMKLNAPASGLDATSYEFDFIGAQPGRWRVWAVDAAGREGFKSPWRSFVYLQ